MAKSFATLRPTYCTLELPSASVVIRICISTAGSVLAWMTVVQGLRSKLYPKSLTLYFINKLVKKYFMWFNFQLKYLLFLIIYWNWICISYFLRSDTPVLQFSSRVFSFVFASTYNTQGARCWRSGGHVDVKLFWKICENPFFDNKLSNHNQNQN